MSKHPLIAAQLPAGRTDRAARLLRRLLHGQELQGKPSLGSGQANDPLCVGNKKRSKRHVRLQCSRAGSAHSNTHLAPLDDEPLIEAAQQLQLRRPLNIWRG